MNIFWATANDDYCPTSFVAVTGTLVQSEQRLYNWLCILQKGDNAYPLMYRASCARSPPPKTKKTQRLPFR